MAFEVRKFDRTVVDLLGDGLDRGRGELRNALLHLLSAGLLPGDDLNV